VLRASNFRLASARLVAYTPSPGEFREASILAAVMGKYGKRFNGKVQVLPLPETTPPEFPRIQLASSDGRWEFIGSRLSVESTWKSINPRENPQLSNIWIECLDPLLHHVRDNQVRIGRLGFVIMRSCPIDHPAQILIDRFCNAEVKDPDSASAPLRNSTNFEIHNHKRYALQPDLVVNSWVRCRTAAAETPPTPLVIVEQDINTISEELPKRSFDVEQIRLYFEVAANEAERILGKYFPNGDQSKCLKQ
jgi:hypothetical protein